MIKIKQVVCPDCGRKCIKHGILKSGSQRWFCKHCKVAFTNKINTDSHDLKLFLKWLFSKQLQQDMPGGGRTFRRKTAKFWSIWCLPPKIEEVYDVLYFDGIYLTRKLCVLICCSKDHVLGWYVCRYENSRAWQALMDRIAAYRTKSVCGFFKLIPINWKFRGHMELIPNNGIPPLRQDIIHTVIPHYPTVSSSDCFICRHTF